MPPPPPQGPTVTVIGAGFGGLCMGIKLKAVNVTDFTIFERQRDLGGTWLLNRYPGVACDVPAHGYGFSFERNPNWSTSYAPGAEIHQYMQGCADKYGIMQHCRFNSEVAKLEYDQVAHHWRVTVVPTDGSGPAHTFASPIVIWCVGPQHFPAFPKLPGVNDGTFKGTLEVHSVHWQPGKHDEMIIGKDVVVVGSACSALQVVPAIEGKVKSLTVLQRTPSWIIPKRSPLLPRSLDYSPAWKFAFNYIPGALWLHQRSLFYSYELAYLASGSFQADSWVQNLVTGILIARMRRQLKDKPELIEQCIPKYPLGCKRPVLSNNYLPTLTKPHVHLVTSALAKVESDGVVCANGDKVKADVVIYCTGYKFGDPGPRLEVVAPGFCFNNESRKLAEGISWDGVNLPSDMIDQMRMFKGVAHPVLPNLFMTMGLNSGIVNSYVVTLEAQTEYIAGAVKLMLKQRIAEIRVKQSVVDAYTVEIDKRLEKFTAMSSPLCTSYYKAGGTGKIIAPTPYSATAFKRHLAPPAKLDDEYSIVYQQPQQARL